MFKEELRPKAADALLFYAAPILCATAAFAAFAVVPFGADTTFFGLLDRPIHLAAADVNVGLLVIFAITSMGVYGIVLAGWSSNSKYSLLGGLRSSAQMISYELSYGLSFAAVIMLAGSLSLREIVDQQSGYWFGVHSRSGTSSCSRSGFSFSSSPASPRRTARRSTSLKPSRSWSPGTTPSTAR